MESAVSGLSEDRPGAMLWFIAAVLFVGFFLFEQDIRTSTYDDFVPEPEIREQWAQGGSRARQIAILGLGGFGGLCLLLPSASRIRIADPLTVLAVIYLAYITASYTWSIDPEATQRRLIVLAFFALAVLGIGRQVRPQFIPELTMICLFGYLMLGLACELALGKFQPWSGEHRFAGTTHPNIQASYLVAMSLAAWAVHRRDGPLRPVAFFIMIVGLTFLFFTRSRTSFGGFIVAFLFASGVIADRLRSFKWGFVTTWGACLVVMLVLGLGSNVGDSAEDLLRMGRREAAVEEASSLTGRLPLWVELWDYVELKPVLGHGYEAFWTTDNFNAVAAEIDWAPATAHSSFLECLLDLGYVGFAIMLTIIVVILARLMWNAARDRQPHQGFVLAFFVFTLIYGFTEAGIRSPSTATFFLMLGIVSTLVYRQPPIPQTNYEFIANR